MSETVKDMVQDAMEKVPFITYDEYKQLKNDEVPHTLVDVREESEWEKGHIEGALLIPRGLLEFKINEAVPDKESLIVVHCAKGGRAALCGEALQELGYTNVKNLEGGYEEYHEHEEEEEK